jgi:hypothetical protein
MDEDPVAAQYQFTSDTRVGSFEIDNSTGNVKLINEMPGDAAGQHFDRVAVKIRRAWKTGQLPDFAERAC